MIKKLFACFMLWVSVMPWAGANSAPDDRLSDFDAYAPIQVAYESLFTTMESVFKTQEHQFLFYDALFKFYNRDLDLLELSLNDLAKTCASVLIKDVHGMAMDDPASEPYLDTCITFAINTFNKELGTEKDELLDLNAEIQQKKRKLDALTSIAPNRCVTGGQMEYVMQFARLGYNKQIDENVECDADSGRCVVSELFSNNDGDTGVYSACCLMDIEFVGDHNDRANLKILASLRRTPKVEMRFGATRVLSLGDYDENCVLK